MALAFEWRLSKRIGGFEDGEWLSFGPSYFGDHVPPGGEGRVVLESTGAPSVVMCRAYGGDIISRWPKDMPTKLRDAIARHYYRIWRSGFTIGPSDSVRKMRVSERVVRLRNSIEVCRESGWITAEAAEWYLSNEVSNSRSRSARLRSDLERGAITSEFVALAESW